MGHHIDVRYVPIIRSFVAYLVDPDGKIVGAKRVTAHAARGFAKFLQEE
jgi:hypothetical protein